MTNELQRLGRVRTTIRTKLAVPITVLIGGIALFIVLYFPPALERQELQAAASKARSVADMTAYSAGAGLYFEDVQAIREAFEVARQNPDLEYVVVTDSRGELVASYDKSGSDMVDYRALSKEEVSEDGTLYRVRSPIHLGDRRIGDLYLGLSLAEAREQVREMRRTVAWLSILLFLGGMIIVFAVSAVITKPLRHMARLAEEISDGDLSKRAQVSSRDEAEELADSFNQMVEKLVSANQELAEQKEALHRAHDDLEERVRQRTIDLEVANRELKEEIIERMRTQDELRTAKELAETATRAKSEFLATMSHEIRTPLNGIIGMTGLLIETELADDQNRFAEVIQTSGHALLSLINDILDFSKIEAGQLDLEEAPFSVREVVEEAIDTVSIKAVEKGVALGYVMSETTPAAVIGDAVRVRQILVNLLGNAVKFTDEGEVFLYVRTAIEDGSATLTFEVRDTGIGIPADRMDRLFKTFSQVDSTTTRKYGGTGLGLAICKRLSEVMGGDIWAESEVDLGSTFFFTIRAPVASNAPWYGEVPAYLRGTSALVLDRNETRANALSEVLTAWGMRATVATSVGDVGDRHPKGAGVLIADAALVRERTADLVDAWPRSPERPIILLSDYADQARNEPSFVDLSDQALNLNKPVKYVHLLQALAALCEDWREASVASLDNAHPTERNDMEKPTTILLAEDHPVNREVAEHILRRLGYDVDVVTDGYQVLEAVRKKRYSLVLMDLRMPGMDGFEAARRIRDEVAADHRPLIAAMTADVTRQNEKECRALGMVAFISKPIEKKQLAEILQRYVDRTPALHLGGDGQAGDAPALG